MINLKELSDKELENFADLIYQEKTRRRTEEKNRLKKKLHDIFEEIEKANLSVYNSEDDYRVFFDNLYIE